MKVNSLNWWLILTGLISASAFAFDDEALVFQYGDTADNKVYLQFKGRIFDPPLEILGDKKVLDKEVDEIRAFLKSFYDSNLANDKAEMLTLWAERDRKELDTLMTEEAMKHNSSRFSAIKSMVLKKVIRYGPYYICTLENRYPGDQKFVLNNAMIRQGNQYFMTNALSGDHFYAQVVPSLDSTLFYGP